MLPTPGMAVCRNDMLEIEGLEISVSPEHEFPSALRLAHSNVAEIVRRSQMSHLSTTNRQAFNTRSVDHQLHYFRDTATRQSRRCSFHVASAVRTCQCTTIICIVPQEVLLNYVCSGFQAGIAQILVQTDRPNDNGNCCRHVQPYTKISFCHRNA